MDGTNGRDREASMENGWVNEKIYRPLCACPAHLRLRYDTRQGEPLRHARFCQIQQHYENPLSKPDGSF